MTWRFKEFLAQNKDLDEAAFVVRFPHPFLVSEGQGSSGSPSSSKFQMGGDEATKTVPKPAVLPDESQIGDDSPWIIAVQRKDTSKQTSIVTVGRADDCDVKINHALVSKRHAYFNQDAEGAWQLACAGATNNTFANGEKLEPHKPRRLADSEAIRFGPGVKYRFFSSKAFFAFMSMRARMKDSVRESVTEEK